MGPTRTESGPRGRVVVTGVGLCVPSRPGREHAWADALAAGGRLGGSEPGRPPRAEIQGFDPTTVVDRKKALKLMGPNIQFALHASREAWADSGRTPGHPDGGRAGTVLGVRVRPGDFAELAAVAQASSAADGMLSLTRLGEQGMAAIFPLSMLKNLPNMVAAHVTIQLGLQGFTDSITSGEISGLQAIGEAYEVIRRGDAEIVLAGGADDMVEPLSHGPARAGWKQGGGPAVVASQGAAVLVLETAARARARPAGGYAEVLGYAEGFGEPSSGRVVAGVIRRALDAAGLEPAAVDVVWTDACGLASLDRGLADGMSQLYPRGTRAPRLAGQAARVGHLGAAAGAVEAAFACLSCHAGQVPAFLGSGVAPEGGCETGARAPTYAVVVSGSSQGGRAALVLGQMGKQHG